MKTKKFMKASKAYISDSQTKFLKASLYSWMHDKLSSSEFNLNDLLNKKNLIKYIENFKKDEKISNSNFIWQLMSLKYLYRKN
tara:strand:+ start:251 stop:499 length:249 start_codon:yes stop_codon:yes gene_type:complete